MAALSSSPLALIVIASVLPFADQCNSGQIKTPLQFVIEAGDPLVGFWAATPFVAAGVLLALTVLAVSRRSAPPKWMQIVGGLAIASGFLADALWLLINRPDASTWERGYAHGALGACVVAVLPLLAARRGREWTRWRALLFADAVVSAPLCWVVLSAPSLSRVGAGGVLYVGGEVAVLALAAPAIFNALFAGR